MATPTAGGQTFLNISCEFSVVKRMIFWTRIQRSMWKLPKKIELFHVFWQIAAVASFEDLFFMCMTLNQKNCHFEPMILRANPLHVNHNAATCPSTLNWP